MSCSLPERSHLQHGSLSGLRDMKLWSTFARKGDTNGLWVGIRAEAGGKAETSSAGADLSLEGEPEILSPPSLPCGLQNGYICVTLVRIAGYFYERPAGGTSIHDFCSPSLLHGLKSFPCTELPTGVSEATKEIGLG